MTQVEEQIFDGDCRGGCMQKESYENEIEPAIL